MSHLDAEQMRILRKEGKTYQEIGDIAGVSRQRIHQILNGYTDIERRRKLAREYYRRKANNA